MKHQWMPFFWGDFLANTMHLSAQEVGAYVLLIAHAWEHNACIPVANAQRIARVGNRNWRKVWENLAPLFEVIGTIEGQPLRVRSSRVATELAIAAEISNKRKGAAEQMHANRRARAEQMHPHHTTPLKNKKVSNGKNAKSSPRHNVSLELQLAQKKHLGISPDKGPDYRAPPAKKSDNVLQPIPDKPLAKLPPVKPAE
jgi:uncharacterized protein YdaU (DUF1376 family)